MDNRHIYRLLSLSILILLLVNQLSVIASIAYSNNNVEIPSDEKIDYAKMFHKIDPWIDVRTNTTLRKILFNEVIPPSGKYYDPYVEALFWTRMVPEKLINGYYEEYLFKHLVPENWSNGYYFVTLFRDILGYGFRYYYLRDKVNPITDYRVFHYYYSKVFKHLVIEKKYDGFYYNITFDKLYIEDLWGYQRILAYLAYYDDPSGFYALELTRIDLKRQLENWKPRVSSPNVIDDLDLGGPSVLNIELYTPEGPLANNPVYIYSIDEACGVGYCGGNYLGTVYTNSSGKASVKLPPGTYMLKLGGLAAGIIRDIEVGVNDVVNISEMLGKLVIEIKDRNGSPLAGLGLSLSKQIYTPDGEPSPGTNILYDTLDSTGKLVKYMVPGTYIAEVEIPNLDYPYLPNIVVEEGVTKTYNFVIDAVPLTIYVSAPVNAYYYIEGKIYGPGESDSYIYIDLYNGSNTIWLKPGEYRIVYNRIYFNYGYIKYYNVTEITLIPGYPNYLSLVLGRIVWMPRNLAGLNVEGISIEIEKALYNGSRLVGSVELGYVTLKYGEDAPLPLGKYILKPWVTSQYLKEIPIEIIPPNSVIIDDYLPVGFLNLSTVFDDIDVGAYYELYRFTDSTYSYIGGHHTGRLVPLVPGKYRAIFYYMGYNNTVENITIYENTVTSREVRVGKLIIHIYSYNNTLPMYSIPVYIVPYINGSIEYIDSQVKRLYISKAATTYLLPGTYAIIIPGINTTEVSSWINIGYGVSEVNITIDPSKLVNKTYELGRIHVRINYPDDMDSFETPLNVYLATQEIVNGTVTIGEIIRQEWIWSGRRDVYFEVTPGVYTVYIGFGKTILNNSIRYGIAIDPGGLAEINYTLNIVTLNFTLSNGYPAKYLEIYVFDEEGDYYWLGYTDSNGLLTVALLEGSYRIGYYNGMEYKDVATINVSNSPYQLFHIVIPTGCIRIHAYGPDGKPLPDIGFRVSLLGIYTYTTFYTDLNGVVEAYVPAATYEVYPRLYTSDDQKVVTYIDEGTVYDIVFRFDLIKIVFNTSIKAGIYIYLLDLNTSTYRYIYVSLYRSNTYYLYVLQGNYSIILPGINTSLIGPYGYGYEYHVFLNKNDTITVIKYNLTYISFYLDIDIELDRSIYVELGSITPSGERDQYIDSKYIYSWSSWDIYRAVFIVTPGKYYLLVGGYPYSYYSSIGYGLFYTNLSATLENPITIKYKPGLLLIKLSSSIGGESKTIYISVWTGSSWYTIRYLWMEVNTTRYAYLSGGLYRVGYPGNYVYVNITEGETTFVELNITGIRVKLRGPENEPIVNAAVLLYTSTGSYVDTEYTDEDGEACFIVSPGNYTIVLRGLNYYYDKYYTSVYENYTFGNGGAYNVVVQQNTFPEITITLARIDFYVYSVDGPASEVQASLYDPSGTFPLKGGITDDKGYVHFYVTPGNYSIVIRGYDHGWWDYYYLGLPYYKSNGYGDIVEADAPAIDVYSYSYMISELIVYAKYVNGTNMSGQSIQVYTANEVEVHEGMTNEQGCLTIYLTNGTYKVKVLDQEDTVTLLYGDKKVLNYTFARIHVKINLPEEWLWNYIDTYSYQYRVIVFKDYSGLGTGTYLNHYYIDENGEAVFNLPAYKTYQIVLPGRNTTYDSYGYGYGTYVEISTSSDQYVVFNLSVIGVYVEGPGGPVNGISVKYITVNPTGTYGYESTRDGYAFFIVTRGEYELSLTDVVGVEPYRVYVGDYDMIIWNKTVALLTIYQNGSSTLSYLYVYVEDAYTHDYGYYSVYRDRTIYIDLGTYYIYTDNYNGYIVNQTIDIDSPDYYDIWFYTGNIYVNIYKPDGTKCTQYLGMNLYTQKGTPDNPSLDRYVRYDYDYYGTFIYRSLTPGVYAVVFPSYGTSIGYQKYIYNIEVKPGEDTYVNYTLGGLVVKVLNGDGTPARDHLVKLYTSTGYGTIGSYIATKYTDENGTAVFYVTSGTYALYIENLGYVYGIKVRDGVYTNATYMLSPVDLAIANVTYTPTNPGDGDTVLFTVNITNNGPGHVLVDFNVRFYLNNTLVYETDVPGLLAGYWALITAPIKVIAGVDEVRIVIDEELRLFDGNRSNNEYTLYVNVLKPDLAVTNISVSKNLVDGGNGYIYVNITNYGPSGIHRRFYIDLYIDNNLVKTFAVDQLEKGGNVTLTYVFKARGGCHIVKAVIDPGNQVIEENETNNVMNYTFYVSEPDLVVENVAIDTPEYSDGVIAIINATITNNGADTVRSFFIYMYLDGELYATNYRYNGLGSGESFNTLFYLSLKGGVHNITIVVDPHHRIGDSNWSNNIYTYILNIPTPDLAIQSVTYSPSTPGDGEVVVFNITISNIGVGKTYTNFYVSLYVDGVEKTTTYITRDLEPGDTFYTLLSIRMSAGNRSVKIVVDPEHRIGDAVFSNNIWETIITVLNSDLAIKNLYFNTSTVNLTNYMTGDLVIEITNYGPGNVNKTFYVAIFDNDRFVEQIPVNGLAVGETKTLVSKITFYTGNHTYKVIVDDHYQRYYGATYVYRHRYEVSDPDRTNNEASVTVYVKGPDLVVTDIYVDPETPYAYSMFSVNITIGNIGDYDLTIPIWGVLCIDDRKIAFEIPPINVGEYVNVTIKHIKETEPGLHKITAKLNPYKEVLEHRYDNNEYTYMLNIPYPDLAIDNVVVDSPKVINSLEDYNVTVTIVNNGWGFTKGFYVAIRQASTGNILSTYYIDHGLMTGEKINVTLDIIAIPPGGNLLIHVDSNYYIVESSESNNKMIVPGPLVRGIALFRTTYEFLQGVLENDTLRIVNVGGVSINITGVIVGSPYIYVNTSLLPVTLLPGKHIDIPFHVDTFNIGTGVYGFNITVLTDTPVNITEKLTITIYDPEKLVDLNVEKVGEPYSLDGYGSLYVEVRYRYIVFSKDSLIVLSGNGTVFTYQTTYTYSSGASYLPILLRFESTRGSPGYYVINVTLVTPYGVNKSVAVAFTLYSRPFINIISPRGNNTVLASTTLVLTWGTNVPTNATIYFRDVSSSTWTKIDVKKYSCYHSVNLGGLIKGHTYEFYITVYTVNGYSNTTDIYRFNVTTSVVFVEHEINITIDRDYNQLVYIKIRNLDPSFSHKVYAKIINTDPEIILDFIGPGSIDGVLEINPMDTANVMLAIHAQDTVKLDYTVTAILVDLETNATDYMVIHIKVHEPVFDVEVKYLGRDNYTLIQTYELINHGDTITDLKVYLTGPISSYAYIYPSMNHVYLRAGEKLIFYVIPVLSKYPDDPSLLNGSIVVETQDPDKEVFDLASFTLTPGFGIFAIIMEHMVTVAKANDWYCTNRPHVTTKLKISTDPEEKNQTIPINATLIIYFSPQYSHWHVKPHDGTIYVNGVPVYSWHNTIPEGFVAAQVPPSAFTLSPSGGISDIEVTVDSQHMNGGHYVVATSYTMIIETSGGKFYIAAPDYDTAREKVYNVFKPNMESAEPKKCDKNVKMPTWLQTFLNTLPDKATYDFEDVGVPALVERFTGGQIEPSAKVSFAKSVSPTSVQISISGEFELYIGTWGLEGSTTGSASWGVQNCKWRFLGAELSARLMGGYRLKADVPVSWLSWVTDDPVEFEVKVLIGVTSSKILLDEHLHVKSVVNLLFGITISGKAAINLGTRIGLEASAEATGNVGWVNSVFTGKITVTISGDVKVKAGWLELSKGGSYSIGWRWQPGTGWRRLKPGEDPEILVFRYVFYGEQLKYPYIMLATNYSSAPSSIGYSRGYGLFASWIASSEDEAYIMLSRYIGGTWTTPETLPFTSTEWYYTVYSLGLDNKPGVIVVKMPKVNLSTATYADILNAARNMSLLYSEYVNGSWTTPVEITDHGVTPAVDAEAYGSTAIVAWATNSSDEYMVEVALYSSGSWSTPVTLPGSGTGSLEYKIRDVAVSFINGKPVVYWVTDVYRNVSGDYGELVTIIKYSVLVNGSWTTPAEIPGTWKAMYISSISSDQYVVAWSDSGQKIHLTIFNDTAWNTYVLGDGEEPYLSKYLDTYLILCSTYGGQKDLILYSFNVSSETYNNYLLTSDEEEDSYYNIYSLPDMGKAVVVWSRRPSNTSGLGENETWAYGLYYLELGSFMIKSVNISAYRTVEGNTVSINISLYASTNSTALLKTYINDSVIYCSNVTLKANETKNYIVTYTPPDKGAYIVRIVVENITPPSISPTVEKTLTIYADRLLNITEPKPYSYVGEVFNISGEVNGVKPVNMTVMINNTVIETLHNITGKIELAINTTKYNLTDAPLNITIYAVTIDGSAEDTYNAIVYLDKTPPTLKIIYPANNTYVHGIVEIVVEAYDKYYRLPSPPKTMVNGSALSLYMVNNTYYHYILNTTMYPDNRVLEIKSIVVDNSGKQAQYTIYLIPDNTPPVAVITSPSDEALVSNVINITFNYSDTNLYMVYLVIDNETYNVMGQYYYLLNTTEYPDGSLTISLIVVDKAGNNATKTITIVIDNTPPKIEVMGPYGYVKGVVDIAYSIEEPHLDIALLYINGTPYNVTGLYRYIWNTTAYLDGVYNLTIYARDLLNHSSSYTWFVVVDNTAPTTIDNSTSQWYNHSVVIKLTPIDNVSGVNTTYYRIDYGNWTIGTTIYIPAPPDHSNDGLHFIEYYSIDNAGNIEEIKNKTIGIDTVKPLITCSLENNTYFSGGKIDIYYYLYDGGSGLKYYEVYMDGSLYMRETLHGEHNYTITLLGILISYLNDGKHTIEVRVWDIAGNEETYLTVYYVDKTAPTAKILSPVNNAVVTGLVNITFNYSDNMAIDEVLLRIGGETFDVTGQYYYLLDTTKYPDGSLTISLTVKDKAGNTAITTITIVIDNTPPVITINTPADHSYVSGNITVTYTVEDDHLDQVWMYIDGLSYNITGINSYILDTTLFPDGEYNITIYANDTLGHESTAWITIIIDNTPPQGSITYPLNNTYVSGKVMVIFSYSDENLEKVYLYLDQGSVDVTGLNNYTIDTTQYGDGEHVLKLVVIDKAGNTYEYSIVVVFDNTPPVAVITSPSDEALVSDVINITFNYSDTNLYMVYLVIDNETYNVTGEHVYTLDTTLLNDGLHNISIIAIDKAGNTGTDMISIVVDNTPPVIEAISPIDYARGTVNIEYSIDEPHLVETILYINGTPYNVTGLYTYPWNTTTYPDGVYNLTIYARDSLNHSSSYTWFVVIDNTPPTVLITYPSTGALVSRDTVINFTYSDLHLDKALLYIDDTVYLDVTGSYSTVLDTTQYIDGIHKITLKVYDKAGNEAEYTVYIEIDNTPPKINITSPTNNTVIYIGDPINISWTIDEPYLENVTLYIGMYEINVTGLNNYTVYTANMTPGLYRIVIKAYDKTGNIGTASVYVNLTTVPITTTPPGTTSPTTSPKTTPKTTTTPTKTSPTTSPAPGISGTTIAAVIIIVLIIVVAAYLFLRKK